MTGTVPASPEVQAELERRVADLREFEADYRTRLRAHLHALSDLLTQMTDRLENIR
jgi:hypothetical protein